MAKLEKKFLNLTYTSTTAVFGTDIPMEYNVNTSIKSYVDTGLAGKQASDSTLTALAAYNTNGLLTQTAADTFVGRTITAANAYIVVNDGNGVVANPTIGIGTNVATLDTTQTFSAAKTFSSTFTVSGGSIDLTHGTANKIQFGTVGAAVPGVASAGLKIKLNGANGNMAATDYAIGIESNNMWFNTGSGIKWYSSTTLRMLMDSSGNTAQSGRTALGTTTLPTTGAWLQINAASSVSTSGLTGMSVAWTATHTTGAMTNAYGILINAPTKPNAGTITNAYGLYAAVPTVATNNYAAYFNGATSVNGTLTATLFSGSGASLTSLNGSNISSGTVAVGVGGTGLTSYTAGDLIYASGTTTLVKLAKGSANQVLAMNSGATAPEWKSLSTTDISGIGALTGTTNISWTINSDGNPATDIANLYFIDSTTGLVYDASFSTLDIFANSLGLSASSVTTPGTLYVDGATTLNSTLNVTSSVTANSFSGNGASLTSLNGSNISSGTVADVRLSAEAQDAITKRHSSNQDTGTTNSSFTIFSGNNLSLASAYLYFGNTTTKYLQFDHNWNRFLFSDEVIIFQSDSSASRLSFQDPNSFYTDGYVEFTDTGVLKLGASVIEISGELYSTSNLKISQVGILYWDNTSVADTTFQNNSSTGDFTITVSGDNFTIDVTTFIVTGKIQIGNDGDCTIQTNGDNTFITTSSTGSLRSNTKELVLNTGLANGSSASNPTTAGITVDRSGSNDAKLYYEEASKKWYQSRPNSLDTLVLTHEIPYSLGTLSNVDVATDDNTGHWLLAKIYYGGVANWRQIPLSSIGDIIIDGSGDVESINLEGTPSDSFTINNDAATVTSLIFSTHASPGTLIWYPPSSGGYGGADPSFELSDELYVFGDISSYGVFRGDGSGLGYLNADNIETGTLDDARLSSNIPLKNAANTFTNSITATLFTGSGAGLTLLQASALTGTLDDARLSSNIPRLNAASNAFTNLITAGRIQVSNASSLPLYVGITTYTNVAAAHLYDAGYNYYFGGQSSVSKTGNYVHFHAQSSQFRLNSNIGQYYQINGTSIFSIVSTGVSVTGNVSMTGTQMLMNTAGRTTINFGQNAGGVNPPSTNAQGLKIKLYGATTDNSLTAGEYGIGIESGNQYYVTGVGYKWYSGGSLSTVGMSLQGSNLSVTGTLTTGGAVTTGGDISVTGKVAATKKVHTYVNEGGYGNNAANHASWANAYTLPADKSLCFINSWDGTTAYDVYCKLPDTANLEAGQRILVRFSTKNLSFTRYVRFTTHSSTQYLGVDGVHYAANDYCWKVPMQNNAIFEFVVTPVPNQFKNVWFTFIYYMSDLGASELI